jgi:serine protease Do
MKRSIALLGGGAILVLGLALTSVGARAGGQDTDETADKTIEKRIEIVGLGEGGFLGVDLDEVDGPGRGAKVRSVEPDSAAEKAGVEDGDVITRFDGEAVRSARQLARLVRETPAGREVTIEVMRGGSAKSLTATLGEGASRFHRRLHLGDENVFLPELEDQDIEIEVPEVFPHGPGPGVFRWHGDGDHDFTMGWVPERPRLGIRFMEIGSQLASYFELSADEAVLVAAVTPDSPAAKAGVQAGDIVLKFDGRNVRDAGDLVSGVRSAKGGEPVPMTVHRKGRTVDLQVSLPSPERAKKTRPQSGVTL